MSLTDEQRIRRSDAQRKYYHNPDNRHKDLARGAVFEAIKSGRLVRKPCERCGSEKSEAHHEDYSRPLHVSFLCRDCHGLEHRKSHCCRGHALTAENLYVNPTTGKRRCRLCKAEDMKAFYARRALGGVL